MLAGVIGATGYAGAELVRLLSGHPEVTDILSASVSHHGESIESVFPQFVHARLGTLLEPADLIARSDIVFGALPSGKGEAYAKACLDRGVSYIDLSADFRFDEDEEAYRAWYGKSYDYGELRKRSVYGLCELNREKIKTLAGQGPLIIGNPGCYPTAVSLAAFPVMAGAAGVVPSGYIIADAISGVTGAGRETGRAYHFPECADSASPYKVGSHRHTPEIFRNLNNMSGPDTRPRGGIQLVFTPHLGPFNRGILATVYFPLDGCGRPAECRPAAAELAEKTARIRDACAAFYHDEPFVRVLPAPLAAATNRVRHSNYCDLSIHLDQSGATLIIVSAIDNMVKGAAGQAIQNMNLICGFDERRGLEALPALF
ncbi:MAG: N-acetyl-gamma-glutamyl-phosphate reductase [Treponema sp.]|jgi:N-acetyl-gamma-glutamyl-phosphate reductase|nr:N-acetyl-gamma-glutamyl-phosphate reductase [Treponema sp.]